MTPADPTRADRPRHPAPDRTGQPALDHTRHPAPDHTRHPAPDHTRQPARAEPTVVAEPMSRVVLVWLLSPVLGAGLLWLVQFSAGWIASLPWIPMRGPFMLVDAVDEPWATGGALLLGTLGGLLVAAIAAAERLTVTVTGEGVTLLRGDATRRVGRDEITGAFRDGKRLVLLGRDAEELVREGSDLATDRLRAAFEAHGYRWYADGDPYRADFRRWVDGAPELPAGANGLLKARQRALDKGDKADVAELRAELLRLGVVVREEGKRQYWRRTRPAAGPASADRG